MAWADKLHIDRTGQVFKTRANHQVGGNRLWSHGERWTPHVTLPKTRNMRMKTTQRFIPDRSSPDQGPPLPLAGSTRTEVETMLLADPARPAVPETRL
ncbi:hypothetical protein ElyMa_003479000 [Elysia marginata]|uniref:Uncharacterized protein n=1 Tax=Elysia marginata TaxID=1093978 RepID=A0AAV4ECC8_9GAST|nr:hypothetical protein ElyMa_003479000 [Elysia marginata]